jgi:SelR domain
MRHNFTTPVNDRTFARREFIVEALMLPLAIKVGIAFAAEATDSDAGAHTATTSAIGAKVWIAEFSHAGTPLGLARIDKVIKPDDEWKQLLSAEQYAVTRQGGTEAPFANEYDEFRAKGVYRCVCCRTALFSSETKFDSGPDGRAFGNRSHLRISSRAPTTHYYWNERKSDARDAMPIWDTCSTTVRHQPDYAIA